MPETLRDPNAAPSFALGDRWRSPWIGALAVGLVAVAAFGYYLAAEPHFADESAYYSQSYFARLFFEGRHDDVAWLSYPAFDLPPLPKYLIGASLWIGGYAAPTAESSSHWYTDTSTRFDPPGALAVARMPSVILGALGCVAVYGLGMLIRGRAVGVLAALLLMVNPLYHTHARRAMSDVPCEAFMLVCLVTFLWVWKRLLAGQTPWAAWVGAGVSGFAAGLALLSKFSGAIALMVVASWVALGIALRGPRSRRAALVGTSLCVTIIAGVTFVGLNPALTARLARPNPHALPRIAGAGIIERARYMAELRLDVAANQQKMFAHNAVITAWDKVSTVAVQGFGRFGPFGPRRDDSRIRYDFTQDWGAMLWLSCVHAGALWACAYGLRQAKSGEPPTAWAALDYFVVATTVVTVYLPLAWDRYFLSIQAPSCLLAAGVAVAGAEWIWSQFNGRKGVG